MATYIAPISWGLGDLIVTLPVVQGLVASGESTWLVARSSLQEGISRRIPGLAGSVREEDFSPTQLGVGDRYCNLRDHPIQTGYWWGMPDFEQAYPGFRINDILEVICRDLALPFDSSLRHPLIHIERPDSAGKIAFIPGSDGTYKCWPPGNWLRLYDYMNRLGVDPVLIGEPERCAEVAELIAAGLPWLPTPTLEDAVDVISACRLVIAVDTGLMHLAVHQGIPTIALYRHRPIYLRPYPHCYPLVAGACDPECQERSRACANSTLTEFRHSEARTWTCARPESGRCMAGISAENVTALINQHGLLPASGSARASSRSPSGRTTEP